MNLALAKPADLLNGSPHILLASDSLPATLFLVGTVTKSSLLSGDGGRQVSVAFSAHTWPRALAVLGLVVGSKALYVPGFQGGTSLKTYREAKKGVEDQTRLKPTYLT